MTALFVAGYEETVPTGAAADARYRAFALSLHLRPARDAPSGQWLVEASRRWPYPDQRCSIDWDRAAALGFDLTSHYSTDAAGERFLPGTSFTTTIGAGAPDPEQAALSAAAQLGAPLRQWLSSLQTALDAAGGDGAKAEWPAPPPELAEFACRFEPANIAALRSREAQSRREAADAERARQRSQDADPIYMPHNIG